MERCVASTNNKRQVELHISIAWMEPQWQRPKSKNTTKKSEINTLLFRLKLCLHNHTIIRSKQEFSLAFFDKNQSILNKIIFDK